MRYLASSVAMAQLAWGGEQRTCHTICGPYNNAPTSVLTSSPPSLNIPFAILYRTRQAPLLPLTASPTSQHGVLLRSLANWSRRAGSVLRKRLSPRLLPFLLRILLPFNTDASSFAFTGSRPASPPSSYHDDPRLSHTTEKERRPKGVPIVFSPCPLLSASPYPSLVFLRPTSRHHSLCSPVSAPPPRIHASYEFICASSHYIFIRNPSLIHSDAPRPRRALISLTLRIHSRLFSPPLTPTSFRPPLHEQLWETPEHSVESRSGESVCNWMRMEGLRGQSATLITRGGTDCLSVRALDLTVKHTTRHRIPLVLFAIDQGDYQSLTILQSSRNILHIPCILYRTSSSTAIPQRGIAQLHEWRLPHVFANIEYGLDELRRVTLLPRAFTIRSGLPLVAGEWTQTPTSLAIEGTADPKDSLAYAPHRPSSQLPSPSLSPPRLHHSSYEIHMPLCALRYILRPVILLHRVGMAPGPEVPLIALTFGIHSRLYCPSHSCLPVTSFRGHAEYRGVCSVNPRDSQDSARSADSWAGAAISRTSSGACLTDDHFVFRITACVTVCF
ncbi:hypothetical protein BS47DRAFT_1485537 [Hydnum rufescens UP504]|uniref:Uncharacterized protein n=1 Tax=Hydnum rufescens UP504 TaxID=1448309 RepID=A0A9P6AXL9_9AGAM|nr:hypothetical protein BS47DRAFT_1485537 [Hydnum rufescens UP504]